jgi:pimeloyl-ACP methyl ester carboxylesterase
MPYVQREGVNLYYQDDGQGTPILLSHGFAASSHMWQGQVDAFQHAYRLIRWDMRGHGGSDSPDDQSLYSQAQTIEDMRAILDHSGIGQAIIAGHSLGGFLSLAFHVTYPERVKALILQGCGPGYRNPAARAAWNERAEQRAQKLAAEGLSLLAGGAEVDATVHRSALGLAKAARGILSQVDARVIDSLPHIAVPVLVIIGENDTHYLNGSNYMAARIPNCTKVVVPQAGHGANVEQPQIVNAALHEFLQRL